MTNASDQSTYVIHSDEEPKRLDRQAAIYGTEDDLRHVILQAGSKVLDAGCGSGSAACLFARSQPSATVVGVDRNAQYIDFATREAAKQLLDNVTFRVGDVLSLPFANGEFDVVWSKHLLQWVRQRESALREFVRVARPGGRIVACNFDGFCLQQYPLDAETQQHLEAWFSAAERELGFDSFLGRKLPSMFKAAGLTDIKVDIIPDKAFGGFGGDPERAWNWEVQWRSAFPFSLKVFGSPERAEMATTRILRRFNDPEVFVYTTLFYVEGHVPT